MIQVDDANWGNPIGTTLIGALRVETGEYHVAEIPLELFQGDVFPTKRYLTGAREATAQVLSLLQHDRSEPLEICSGYIHTQTREWFTAQGFSWRTTRVEGALQELIEQSGREHLARLGFIYRGSMEQYGTLFKAAIVWLKGDDENAPMLPERIAVAKSGWATFGFYRDLPYGQAAQASKQFKSRRSRSRRSWRYSD